MASANDEVNVTTVGIDNVLQSPLSLAVVRDVTKQPNDVTLFICDNGNSVLRTLNPRIGVFTTFAGATGFPAMDGPTDYAVFDSLHAIAVVPQSADDTTAHDHPTLLVAGKRTVRRIRDGMIRTIAGGQRGYSDGFGRAAQLEHATGIIVSCNGLTAYFTDTFNNRLRAIDLKTTEVSTAAGDGDPKNIDGAPPIKASLRNPRFISFNRNPSDGCFTDSELYLTCYLGLRRVTLPMAPAKVLKERIEASGAIAGAWLLPELWRLVSEFAADDGAVTTILVRRCTSDEEPHFDDFDGAGIGVTPKGHIIACSIQDGKICIIEALGALATIEAIAGGDGKYGTRDGPGTTATFVNPWSVTIDDTDRCAWICDYGSHSVRKCSLPARLF